MDLKDYLRTMQGKSTENVVLRVLVGVLVLSNAVLAISATSASETVVMVPPYLVSQEKLEPDEATAGLKESWAQHVALLLGNVTPATAAHLKEQVSRITAPSAFNAMMAQIDEQAKKITEEAISISFAPSAVFYLRGEDRVVVSGNYTIRGARTAESSMVRTYEIGFDVKNYSVLLTSIKVYEGAWNPRTYNQQSQQQVSPKKEA